MKSPNKIFIKRRTFWVIILPVSVVTAVLLAMFLLKGGGSSRLDDYKRTLEQSGETLDIAKLAPVAPKENNPAEAFLAACKELSTLASEKNFTPIAIPVPADQSDQVPSLVELPGPLVSKEASTISWEAMEAQNKELASLIEKLREISKAPALEFHPDYSAGLDLNPDAMNASLGAFRFITTDGILALRSNNIDRVMEDIEALLSFSRTQQKQPLLVTQSLAVAMVMSAQDLTWQLIQAHSASDTQLAQLQAIWSKVDLTKNLPAVLRFERALGAKNIEASFSKLVGRGSADTELAIIAHYQELIDAAEEAEKSGVWSSFLQKSAAIGDSMKDRPDTDLVAKTFRSLPDSFIAILQAQAHVNMTIAALGLERFASSEIGHPTTLTDLVPEYLAIVPHDPFDNQELRYKASPSSGFLLYSIGINATDENGDASPLTGVELGRRKDIVWPRPAPVEVQAQ
jgi:hypothetical protein